MAELSKPRRWQLVQAGIGLMLAGYAIGGIAAKLVPLAGA